VKVILISGQTGISAIVENARNAGHVFELLPKPIHPEELLRRLNDH
jgi:DNA-binding NtrC family response regulator